MNRKIVVRYVREHQNSILRTPDWKTKQNGSSECCCKCAPCSHGVRKTKKKDSRFSRESWGRFWWSTSWTQGEARRDLNGKGKMNKSKINVWHVQNEGQAEIISGRSRDILWTEHRNSLNGARNGLKGALFENKRSLLWVGYSTLSNSAVTVGYLFPRWERFIPRLGMFCSQGGNNSSARSPILVLTRNEYWTIRAE